MAQGESKRVPQLPWPDADAEPASTPGPTPTDWGVLVLRAAWRRKWLAAAVFLLGVDASVVYYRTRTPVYRAETTLLAQRQQLLTSVVRSSAGVDAPTRSAYDLVHSRSNLLSLIQEANLMPPEVATSAGTTPREPASPRRWSLEWLKRALGRSDVPAAYEDRLAALVLRLDRDIQVTTTDETVTISIDWPDPQQAYRLVETALQNFLEARQVQEITVIDEAISLLQGRLAPLRAEMEKEEHEAARVGDTQRLPAPPTHSEELARLKSMIESKQRAIGDVEEFRRRRLADLQAQFDAKRGIYSEAHPDIISLRQDVAALSRESPQVAALREEERKLSEEYTARLAHERARGSTGAPAVGRGPRQGAPGELSRASAAQLQYQQMVERVNAAQLDLDTARAAFKYRYRTIWPAQVPKAPVSPKPAKILGLGTLASLLLALLAAVAPDLRSGRIVERWQVERSLDLPIVGEVGRR